MKSREFIAGVGAVWRARANTAIAQAPRTHLVGFLGSTSASPFKSVVDAFSKGLADLGYVANRNVRIEYRWADGRYEELGRLARELIELHPSVIVALAPPAASAAKAITASIPIVFTS